MVQYRIPNLLSLLEAYIKPNNPTNDVLAAEHIAWIDACDLVSDAYKLAWRHAEIPLLTSRAFPESSLECLRVCVDYLTGAFLLDQLTDPPTTAAQARKWADAYKQAFRQTLGETEGPAAVIKHFTAQMLKTIKDPYWSYLVENNILLAESMAKEAFDRENPDNELTLEVYMEVRRDTIGARQLFDIGRWIHEIDIAHEVLLNPDIVKIEDHFVDLISLANDLYSYRKEFLAHDAKHNYITIAFGDPTTGLRENDLQGAIDYTYRKFCQILTDLERRKKALPPFGESEDAKVDKYIRVMTDVVIGTIQWSLECGRYGHSEISRTGETSDWGDVVFDMDPL